MQQELFSLNIQFQKHKNIINIKNKYQCDIFIEPNIVIEYEPVWAIGKNATREATQAETLEMSIFIKRYLSDFFGKNSIEIPILYGGSVNTKNAEVFLREGGVGGLLIGRDSLDPKKFIEILKIAENI